jgi:hypothetical protein
MRKLTAYQLYKAKKINRQQMLVLASLRSVKKASNRHLVTVTGLPINVITPRIYELRVLGQVVQHSTVLDEGTNRTVKQWASA